MTPSGYVNVSQIKVGDTVLSADNKEVKVVKVMKPLLCIAISRGYPHFIPKNSISENVPCKDTFISHRHAYWNGNKWIEHSREEDQDNYNPTGWSSMKVMYYNVMVENALENDLLINGIRVESWGGYENSDSYNDPEILYNSKMRMVKFEGGERWTNEQ